MGFKATPEQIAELEAKGLIAPANCQAKPTRRPREYLEPAVWSDWRFAGMVLPVAVSNRTNSRRHWAAQKKEDDAVKEAVRTLGSAIQSDTIRQWHNDGCTITLTRHGPGKIDSDNLPATLKAVRDSVAVLILGGRSGERDDDPRIIWVYQQVRTKQYGVIVEVKAK